MKIVLVAFLLFITIFVEDIVDIITTRGRSDKKTGRNHNDEEEEMKKR